MRRSALRSDVGALISSAADRNKTPILEVLKGVLPRSGTVLEIASGSGQHVVHFAREMPDLTWIPSDASAQARESSAAWIASAQLPNVRAPVELDVRKLPWPIDQAIDAIVCVNLIHISAWPVTLALFEGARQTLPAAGVLYLYGPYKQGGRHTSPSNEAFDESLRAQNPEWGVRDLDDVLRIANAAGFEHISTVQMPANNLSVVFRKRRGDR